MRKCETEGGAGVVFQLLPLLLAVSAVPERRPAAPALTPS